MLKLSKDLKLPLEAVTEKFAWLGRTGSGKTYGAMKMAELFLDAGAQVGSLDAVGVWRGLRVPATKGGAAFEVYVFGGLYGDLPLEPSAGALIADVVCDRGISFVLDVSQFIPSEQQRFAREFAERFFQRKKAAPAAVHLFIEECQEFIPQNPMGDEARTLHAFQRLWKLGRNFGIGGSLISQRPQEISKKALNMSGTLFAFQMTGPQERKAVREWVADHGVASEIESVLQKLNTGEPHVESPTFLNVSKTIRILPRMTADLSSTPKVGANTAAKRDLSPIDVEKLKADLAATIEKAKADDPRELRKQISDLTRQLAGIRNVPAAKASPVAPKVVEKPVITDAQLARVEKLSGRLEALVGRVQDAFTHPIGAIRSQLVELVGAVKAVRQPALPLADAVRTGRRVGTISADEGRRSPPVPRAPRTTSRADDAGEPLPVGEKATLIAAAQYPGGLTREQATILTGYKRSTRDAYIQRLVGRGYVEVRGSDAYVTQAGIDALGSDYEPLPTGDALRAYWLQRLPAGERAVLDVALGAYPNDVDREMVDERTGFKRSTRDAYIQRLMARKLVAAGRGTVRTSDILFEG